MWHHAKNTPAVAEQAGSCSGSRAAGLVHRQQRCWNLSQLLSSRHRDIRRQNPVGDLSRRTSVTAPGSQQPPQGLELYLRFTLAAPKF